MKPVVFGFVLIKPVLYVESGEVLKCYMLCKGEGIEINLKKIP